MLIKMELIERYYSIIEKTGKMEKYIYHMSHMDMKKMHSINIQAYLNKESESMFNKEYIESLNKLLIRENSRENLMYEVKRPKVSKITIDKFEDSLLVSIVSQSVKIYYGRKAKEKWNS